MSDVNSYFKLYQNENGIEAEFFPPEGNGVRLKIDDVTKYLGKMMIEGYDLKSVNDAITSCTIPVKIHLSNKTGYPVNEYMEVIFSPDRMFAICRFYPKSNLGSSLSKEDIMDELKRYGVKFGILDEAINKYIDNPVYCTGIIMAKGDKPVEGSDAEIQYFFQTDRVAKPHYNEDGTVDFHKLDNINHIHSGDVLAKLKPEDPGKPGMDVCGNKVLPRKVLRLVLKHGKNITMSEDGLKITSDVDGHVTLEGDRVFVSDVYIVGADVDATTGDIEYNGSIEVKGNVRTGFKLSAEGNIEIKGVVEGAEITAKGDIVLHRGVQGMGKAVLKAGGNIISKFIESANVSAGGYVETDTILNSKVSAKGNVNVRGRNGSIIGGTVRATNLIEASIIGSTMGTATVVEVGHEPHIQDIYINAKKEISNLNAEREKVIQVVSLLKKKSQEGQLDKQKTAMLVSALNNIKQIDEKIIKETETIDEVIVKMEENRSAKIIVNRDVFPGAKIVISGDYILVHDAISHCQYNKSQGEIKAFPLY